MDWPTISLFKKDCLFERFLPHDQVSRVEIRTKMSNEACMRKDEDPITLFKQLSTIENQHCMPGKKMDDEDKISVIINAAPLEYQSPISGVSETGYEGRDDSVGSAADDMQSFQAGKSRNCAEGQQEGSWNDSINGEKFGSGNCPVGVLRKNLLHLQEDWPHGQ